MNEIGPFRLLKNHYVSITVKQHFSSNKIMKGYRMF